MYGPSQGEAQQHKSSPESAASVAAGSWQGFANRFRSLADQEGQIPQHEGLNVTGIFEEHPWVRRQEYEAGEPWVREYCLLQTAPHGLWKYHAGVSANINEQFRALAAEAGVALAVRDAVVLPGPPDPMIEELTEPGPAESFWLYQLFSDLRENAAADRRAHQRFLFGLSKDGGMILHVCEASFTFCARLVRRAYEHAGKKHKEPFPAQNSDITTDAVSLTARRATVVSQLRKELQAVRPKMYNEHHYAAVKEQYPGYLIFQIADKDNDVKRWIENVQDRRAVLALAQEVAARHFGVSVSTIRTDWSHRRKPRGEALESSS